MFAQRPVVRLSRPSAAATVLVFETALIQLRDANIKRSGFSYMFPLWSVCVIVSTLSMLCLKMFSGTSKIQHFILFCGY